MGSRTGRIPVFRFEYHECMGAPSFAFLAKGGNVNCQHKGSTKAKGDLSCERPPFLPIFRRSGSEPDRNALSSRTCPVLANRSPPFPSTSVITHVARALSVLSPCARLPAHLVEFPSGSSDFPCGSSESPSESSLIAPRLLSPPVKGIVLWNAHESRAF